MQILLDNAPECLENFFTLLKDKITSLDHHSTLAFGNLEYGKDFTRYYYPPEKEGAFGKTLYKLTPTKEGEEPSELSLVFFGEICPSSFGTALSAKGNHYAGTAENPKPITDDSVVKDIIVLRPLSGDTDEFLRDAFSNQVASLEEIPNEDGAYETPLDSTKPIPLTDFLVSSKPETGINDRSFIKITLGQKYKVPPEMKTAKGKPRSKKNLLKQKDRDDVTHYDNTAFKTDDSGSNPTRNVELGGFYDLDLLPDHQGDYFQHVHAKLIQLDIRDEDDVLIPAWEMMDKLRPGTVVLIDTTLVCWHIFAKGKGGKLDRRVYQVQGHRLKVLKKSDAPSEDPIIPRLPRVDNQLQLKYDNSPRKKPSSAFSSFASPSKKPRLDM